MRACRLAGSQLQAEAVAPIGSGVLAHQAGPQECARKLGGRQRQEVCEGDLQQAGAQAGRWGGGRGELTAWGAESRAAQHGTAKHQPTTRPWRLSLPALLPPSPCR